MTRPTPTAATDTSTSWLRHPGRSSQVSRSGGTPDRELNLDRAAAHRSLPSAGHAVHRDGRRTAAYLADSARQVVLKSLIDIITNLHRVLTDCLQHSQVVCQICDIAINALQAPRKAPLRFDDLTRFSVMLAGHWLDIRSGPGSSFVGKRPHPA